MIMLVKIVAAYVALAVQAEAATIRIHANTNLTFTPDTITAAAGDILEFVFSPQNHSVARGDFSSPCRPAAGGFFSGYNFATSAGEAVRVKGLFYLN
jgi:plastocyanin